MIQTAINAANIAYTNSQMSVEMRLVGVVEINYVEDSKLGTNLDRLTDVDGIIDDVHELRDSLGADFVVLVTAAASADACGIGWLNTSFTGASSYAFSVMQLGCLSQYTLAHEIGHNMGCAHDHLHPAYTGVYPWSFGHRFTAGAEYRTIMAYAPGTRINYFSNPNVLYNGVATGVAHGLEGEADNAGTIDATAPYFSAFRAEVAPTLSISPGFVSLAGPVGGPFSPASTELTLENLTGVAIEWSAAADPVSVPDPANPGGPELELDPVYFSPSSGVLGGGGQVAITVTPTSDSEQLPAGLHETALTVSDLTNPGEQAIALVNVEARDPSQFEFGAVGEQHAGEPFAVSLTARDSTGALVRGFTGAAEIGAFTPGGGAAGQADVGREDAFTYYPFVSFYSDVRIQMVYLDGEINISSPTLITGLSFNMTTTAAMDLENFTIRIRPFEADTLSTSTWINDGWTVAYQGTFPVGAAGARDVVFQVPFYYEGEGNLLVDISYNNAAGGESLGEIGGIFSETLRMLYHYDSGESGDPLNWSGTTPPPSDEYFLPFIRLLTEENTPVGVDPAGTGSFTGGVWTGTLTIGTEASDVRLTARTGGASGVSGSFDVVEPVVVILTEAWVDYAWGGVETGSQAQPFNTLAEALAASEDGATIHVKPGSGAEAIRITKPVRIDAPLGAATIGR